MGTWIIPNLTSFDNIGMAALPAEVARRGRFGFSRGRKLALKQRVGTKPKEISALCQALQPNGMILMYSSFPLTYLPRKTPRKGARVRWKKYLLMKCDFIPFLHGVTFSLSSSLFFDVGLPSFFQFIPFDIHLCVAPTDPFLFWSGDHSGITIVHWHSNNCKRYEKQ